MKIKKFLKNASELLGIDFLDSSESKKKSLKKFINDVYSKKEGIEKKLKKKDISREEKEQLTEELLIYIFQLKKAQKLLSKKTK